MVFASQNTDREAIMNLTKWGNRIFVSAVASICAFLLGLLAGMISASLTPSNAAQIFNTFAEVGGTLIGFVGLVGVFTLDAVRSAIFVDDRHGKPGDTDEPVLFVMDANFPDLR